jgi:hypothetical protein
LCDQQYEMALSSNGVNPQNAPVLQPEEQWGLSFGFQTQNMGRVTFYQLRVPLASKTCSCHFVGINKNQEVLVASSFNFEWWFLRQWSQLTTVYVDFFVRFLLTFTLHTYSQIVYSDQTWQWKIPQCIANVPSLKP